MHELEFQGEPTPYQDNRAILYDRTLRDKRRFEEVLSVSGKKSFSVEWEDIDGEKQVTVIDDQFRKAHNKIVYSLYDDLTQTDTLGVWLAQDVQMDVNKEYDLRRRET